MTSPAAAQFADELTDLLSKTVGSDVAFGAVEVPTGRVIVAPGQRIVSGKPVAENIPLRRTCDDDRTRLWLSAKFNTDSDDDGYLRIRQSTFGIWVQPDVDKSERPVFRIEFDRDKTSKPAAHVHFHAESAELGWLYGTAGSDLPRFDEVHFPLGGRRFRPTLEDLLLFLDTEGLYDNWQPNWRGRVQEGLDRWHQRQAKATARAFPEATADQLREMGWKVSQTTKGD